MKITGLRRIFAILLIVAGIALIGLSVYAEVLVKTQAPATSTSSLDADLDGYAEAADGAAGADGVDVDVASEAAAVDLVDAADDAPNILRSAFVQMRLVVCVLGVICLYCSARLRKPAAVKFDVNRIFRSKLTWAVVAEMLLLLVCLLWRPDFFSIQYQESSGLLYGSLIDILNRSAEITIIAMGMTLVIATGGTDLSVGTSVAVSGALALKLMRWDLTLYPTPGDWSITPFILVLILPLLVCLLMGLFNGVLISRLKIQPIIATLILMVAGRGIAQIITNGKQMTTLYSPFRFLAQGSIMSLPMPVIIMIAVVVLVVLFTRKTSFGLFVESVGVNPSASRVSGLNSRRIILLVYALTAVLAGISGLIYSSRIMSNDSNNAGLNYELDAILAVVIGGTSMSGGKFNLAGTVVGSLIIRTIVTFVYYFGIAAEATMAFKALIVAVVIVLQSEPVRLRFAQWSRRRSERRVAMMGGDPRA